MTTVASDVGERTLVRTRRRVSGAEVAWVMLFLDGLLLGMGSLFWLLRGHFFDTRFYDTVTGGIWPIATALGPSLVQVASAGVRLAGLLGSIASIFIVATSATSFRRRERWAWYVMWTLPAFAVFDFAIVAGYQAATLTALVWDLALFALALAALVLTVGEFFPNGGDASAPAQ